MAKDTKTMPSQCWMTEKQVAEMTGISQSTLQKHRFQHKGIPYAKIGASVRYLNIEVQKFMASCQVKF